jgi:hypothetical protein
LEVQKFILAKLEENSAGADVLIKNVVDIAKKGTAPNPVT